jgi:hypothetical protein
LCCRSGVEGASVAQSRGPNVRHKMPAKWLFHGRACSRAARTKSSHESLCCSYRRQRARQNSFVSLLTHRQSGPPTGRPSATARRACPAPPLRQDRNERAQLDESRTQRSARRRFSSVRSE